MADPSSTGPPPAPAAAAPTPPTLAELPEALIAEITEAMAAGDSLQPTVAEKSYGVEGTTSLLTQLKFPTATVDQARLNPYSTAKYVGIFPDGNIAFLSDLPASETDKIYAIDLAQAAKGVIDSKIGNTVSVYAEAVKDPAYATTPEAVFTRLKFHLDAAYSTTSESLWENVKAQLDDALKSTADKETLASADLPAPEDIGNYDSWLSSGNQGDFKDAAEKSAESTVDSYFAVPADGSASAVKLKEDQRDLVVSFLSEAYQIITLYQQKVFKDLGFALTYGRSTTWTKGLSDIRIERHNAYVNATAGGDLKAALLTAFDDAGSGIAACIGPLGWVNASELGVGFSSDTLMDLIRKGSTSKAPAPTPDKPAPPLEEEIIRAAISAKAVEAVQKTNYWGWYVDLINLYARVLLAMKFLEDGEISEDEAQELEDLENAKTQEALAAIVVAAAPKGGVVTVGGAGGKSPKQAAAEKAKESASNIRTSTRDYFTINTPSIAAYGENRRKKIYKIQKVGQQVYNPEDTFRGVYPIEGRSESGVSQLLYNENQQALLDLTPAEISSLVPMVRIFKKGLNGGKDYEQELPFENNVINSIENKKARDLNGNMIVENYNKGNSVGIRSFDWDYQGTNPANDTKDITMTLTLYFQSFSDILRVRDLGSPVGNSPGTFSYADLITRPKNKQDATNDHTANSYWDPEYYRIKFLVGHAYSDPVKGAGDIIPKKKRFAIDTTALPIIATLIDHRFDIQQDGSVNLIITYRGYLEAIAFSQGANIFANSQLQTIFKETKDLHNKIMNVCSTGRAEALKANITQQLDWFGKELQQEVFSSIISNLRKDNKIYSINPYVKDLISRKVVSSEIDWWPPVDPDAPDTISEMIKAGAKSVSRCKEGDRSKCVEDIFSKHIQPANIIADGRRPTPFFFVGDLIKSVKMVVEDSYATRHKDNGTAAQNAFKNTRIILTDIRVTQNPNVKDVFESEVNLADIPISVETFSVWFVKYITKYQGNRQFPEYSFGLFLSDFLRTVLNKFKSFADETGTSHSLTDASSIQRTQLYAPEDTVGACAATLRGTTDAALTYNLFLPTGKCKAITRVSQKNKGATGVDEGTIQMYATKAAENWINYFIYYPNIAGTKDGTASFPKPTQENLKMGYYQFNFGVNSGMVKKITFEKDDQPYVREARFFASETNYKTNRILQLREPYKITIETFGLPTIFPGAVCYIDSRTIDMALGKISDPHSMAYMLGFGGYHMITHVKNSIKSGQFSTTLTAKWTSHGGAKDLNATLLRTSNEIDKRGVCGLFGDEATSHADRKTIEDAFAAHNMPIQLTTPHAAGSILESDRVNWVDTVISVGVEKFINKKREELKKK